MSLQWRARRTLASRWVLKLPENIIWWLHYIVVGCYKFAALACSSRMCLCYLAALCYCACSKLTVWDNLYSCARCCTSMLINLHHHTQEKKCFSRCDSTYKKHSTIYPLQCIYSEKRKKSIECCWHGDAQFLYEAAAGHFAGSCWSHSTQLSEFSFLSASIGGWQKF